MCNDDDGDVCMRYAVTLMLFFSLPRKINSGNSATACLNRLANLQRDSNANAPAAAAAAWVMAAGGAGGVSAEDVWQIIGSFSAGSSGGGGSSSSSGTHYLHEGGGSAMHVMAPSMLCGGPDSSADASLANRSFPHTWRAVIL